MASAEGADIWERLIRQSRLAAACRLAAQGMEPAAKARMMAHARTHSLKAQALLGLAMNAGGRPEHPYPTDRHTTEGRHGNGRRLRR